MSLTKLLMCAVPPVGEESCDLWARCSALLQGTFDNDMHTRACALQQRAGVKEGISSKWRQMTAVAASCDYRTVNYY